MAVVQNSAGFICQKLSKTIPESDWIGAFLLEFSVLEWEISLLSTIKIYFICFCHVKQEDLYSIFAFWNKLHCIISSSITFPNILQDSWNCILSGLMLITSQIFIWKFLRWRIQSTISIKIDHNSFASNPNSRNPCPESDITAG